MTPEELELLEESLFRLELHNLSDATWVRNIIKRLQHSLNQYDTAADKFINKVDTGWARSAETYRELKACRNREAK